MKLEAFRKSDEGIAELIAVVEQIVARRRRKRKIGIE